MRTNNSRRKKLLALFLSMMMLSSAGAAFASCSDDDDSDSSSTTEETEEEKTADDGLIKNAGFETFSTNDGANLIGTSVSGWSRTTVGKVSSKAASGIVDTASWDDLTKSNLGDLKAAELTEEQAAAKWESMSARDKLEYYEAWEDNEDNDDSDIEDLDFYESFNIEKDDLPLYKDADGNHSPVANPGTHWTESDEDYTANKDNTKILMIHNEYSSTDYTKFGTAQKFTSSSTVTVTAGTSAQFSVWVKTSNLETTTSQGDAQDAIDKGAFIRITNTLGGTTLDPVEVMNIDTSGVTENNGWVQYKFLLQGSSYADATFTIVLGLGQGESNRADYVNGYAFFDDIQCETVRNLDETVVESNYKVVKLSYDADEKVFNAADKDAPNAIALDLYEIGSNTGDYLTNNNNWDIKDTREESTNGTFYTSLSGVEGVTVEPGLGFSNKDDQGNLIDEIKIYDNMSAMNGSRNEYLQLVYDNYFKDAEYLQNEKILLLLSVSGAAYTAEYTPTLSLKADGYYAISFYVKTSDMSGYTGAGATVTNKATGETHSLSSIDTSSIEGVDIGSGDNLKEDIYDGWQQCFFFLKNDTDETLEYTLSLSFGPTTIIGSTATSYKTGFAAFANFETFELTEDAYEYATSGTYAKLVALEGEETAAGNGGFDSEVSVGSKIEDGYANLKNYKGVTPDSAYLNSTNTGLDINTLATAGLLSKDELTDEDGNENTDYTNILANLGATSGTNEERWNSIFGGSERIGTATKPLVIYNKTEQAYGFIGTSTSVSDYTAVSVYVKASVDATATVYLTDMDDEDKNTLSIGRNQTYWYDSNGNICAKDPTLDSFNAKKDVAFKLQSNGLYKVNTSWSGASKVADANAYYANMSVYSKDGDGNYVVADGGVSYDYTDKWRNDGNDGIAFYYNKDNGKYYADSAMTAGYEVNDLSAIEGLARYEKETAKELSVTVKGTGKWVRVSFFLSPGDETKNYRLEVWSGTRDGSTKNAANSYVIFDAYSDATLDESGFADNIKERKDDTTATSTYFEGVFSFYDTDKFLRYDETADDNGVGDSYTSYDATSYTSDIAYLNYVNADKSVYEVYANYSLSEITVTADVAEEETEEEEEEEDSDSETNVWLLVSSIAVAGVLLLAIVLLAVRKIASKLRKKRGSNALTKPVKAKKEKPAKKAEKQAEEKKDESDPYND